MAGLTVEIYDTTLRDGAQQEGMNLSVADKMAIAALLDELGVGVIEGGWPGAVPKDTEFFSLVAKELTFKNAQFAAFGMTRRAGTSAGSDPQVRALLDSEAPIITLVAKSDIRHAERALRVSGDENLAMISETVAFLVGEGRRVLLDAEHFFDGYRYDREYAVRALLAGADAGASTLVLCDTNGGMLPDDVDRIVTEVAARTSTTLGMHAHNDSGCAVANSMAAVAAGALHVQGCVNGYGERTGNADLVAVAANLEIKRGAVALKSDGPSRGDQVVARDLGNHQHRALPPPALCGSVGVCAQGRTPRIGDQGGPRPCTSTPTPRASATTCGCSCPRWPVAHRSSSRARNSASTSRVRANFSPASPSVSRMPRRRATPSMRPMRRSSCCCAGSWARRLAYWFVENWTVNVASTPGDPTEANAEAVVKLRAGGERRILTVGEGNGPVNALDHALRRALVSVYPEIERFDLVDFKVRIMDASPRHRRRHAGAHHHGRYGSRVARGAPWAWAPTSSRRRGRRSPTRCSTG